MIFVWVNSPFKISVRSKKGKVCSSKNSFCWDFLFKLWLFKNGKIAYFDVSNNQEKIANSKLINQNLFYKNPKWLLSKIKPITFHQIKN